MDRQHLKSRWIEAAEDFLSWRSMTTCLAVDVYRLVIMTMVAYVVTVLYQYS